ncbi:MFS transporter, partial [Bradyrhizobium sp. WSM 1704]|nr:MFS transporter [Bradyrhizobium semiaridum]
PLLIVSHLLIAAAVALCAWAGMIESRIAALSLLGIGAVLLDFAITTDQTLGRRAVNLLRPEARGRINGLFVALFFIGGAVGGAAATAQTAVQPPKLQAVDAAAFGVLGFITDLATKTGSE